MRTGWEDVIFRERPRGRGSVSSRGVGTLLGDIVYGRLARHGRLQGMAGAVDARWLPLSGGGALLQLRMGGVPLAEMADLDRDGRAETVLLNGR